MGLPTANGNAVNGGGGSSSSNAPQASTTSTSNPPNPSSAASLPPEAIELATKLFDLAREGSSENLGAYVAAGIPPNLTNQTGDTLLMLAAYHGHAQTVKTLLDHGSDPNVVNDRGQSPIAGAVFKGHIEVVKVLLEGGADIHGGQPTAVDCARMFKRDDVLTMFGVEEGTGNSNDLGTS